MDDTLATLTETDRFQQLLTLLKESDVAAFRCPDFEIEFTVKEPEPSALGFVKKEQRAGEVVKELPPKQGDYHKAFNGSPPAFPKPTKG